MQMQWIGELKQGDKVSTRAAVVKSDVLQKRCGAYYLHLTVCDRSGKIAVKWWEPTSAAIEQFASWRFLHIQGEAKSYHDKLEIHLAGAPTHLAVPDNLADWLLCSPIPFPQLEQRLNRHIQSVQDCRLKALLDAVFLDEKLSDSFCRLPAAINNHHAFCHGLLQHTLEVADIVGVVSDQQQRWGMSGIWRDLAVTGALLHDIGKVEEIQTEGMAHEFTLSGSLLGHITLGMMRLARKIDSIRRSELGFPKRLEELVLHLVSSHHGKGEWGSPKAPMLPEALLIHMADKFSTDHFFMQEARMEAAAGVDIALQRKLDSGFGNPGRFVHVGDIEALREQGISQPNRREGYAIPRELQLPILRLVSVDEAEEGLCLTRSLPVYGKIAAGQPLQDSAFADGEQIIDAADLGDSKAPYYLLRVQGDSMIGDGINDGDLIVVRFQETAEVGDLVVAQLEEEGATVKRLARKQGNMFLMPSNPAHLPIAVPNPAQLKIQGRVIGVAR